MFKLMKAKVFEIIITCLLSLLLGIGIYFVNRLEACEIRIRTLENKTPALTTGFETIDAKIDGIKGEITLLTDLVLRLLDKNGLDTSSLGSTEAALAEERRE